jgi:hypothetical protein
VAYQGGGESAHAGAGGAASQQNGVTNITNIIYNFNLTPSQQLHKQQIEQQMLLQQQNSRHAAGAGSPPSAQDTQPGAQLSGLSPTNQRRIALTQGGNRPGSSKRNSGNGVNYPLINVNGAG